MNLRTNLEHNTSHQIAQGLAQTLADNYILYIKTQNFHWNVIDPRFYSLHKMLEEQYKGMQEEIDELAERIRMIGEKSPGSMRDFLEIGSLAESEGCLTANEMIEQLCRGHEKIMTDVRTRIDEAIELGDQGTGDLYIQHLRFHEKIAWMLKSHFWIETL